MRAWLEENASFLLVAGFSLVIGIMIGATVVADHDPDRKLLNEADCTIKIAEMVKSWRR